LLDCIDHELVHIADYASGKAYQYFTAYGDQTRENIMEYKAWYENVSYNNRFNPSNPNLNYFIEQKDIYKKLLPKGWRKY